MKPFEKILTAHIQKYPKLQPRDIVKLALQSEYGNSHMAKHKVPRYFRFVSSFPMNAAGKILKYKMRDESIEFLGLNKKS